MSDVFITRRGGGIKDSFALIAVTYPQGSVCTCSKGTKTLRAKGTSGSFLFMIPEAGTWTVSCTNGTRTKSKTVVIDRQYQAEKLVLLYSLELIDGISANPDYEIRRVESFGNISNSPEGDSIRFTPGGHSTWHWIPQFNMSEFSVVVLTIARITSNNAYLGVFTGTSPSHWENPSTNARVSLPVSSTEVSYTLDVSGFNDTKGLLCYGFNGYIDIKKIELMGR